MKSFGHTVNIDKDTNYIIGHSSSDHAAVRPNSLINIGDDKYFYTIGNVEKINFTSNFTINNRNLTINGNYENYFLLDDVIMLSYKEYELLTIINISNKGYGYKIGEILSLTGGILSTNTADNTFQSSLLKVEEIDLKGGISKLSIFKKGAYIKFPDKNNKLSGGSGSDSIILVECNLISNRKSIERQVVSARNSSHNTIIEINYSLYQGIEEGEINMSKYKMFLTSDYVGKTLRNSHYYIQRDFTPVFGFPMLIKGSNRLEEEYNHAILQIERKLKELEDKVNSIKS